MLINKFNVAKNGFLLLNKPAAWHMPSTTKQTSCPRTLWGYVAIAFNRVDLDRQQLVGPDRLCAEWVIKNGGGICTTVAPDRVIRDYNTLPPEHFKFKIKVVDGSGASLMKIGLDHFRGCNRIDTVIFHQCKHLESDGLDGIIHLKDTLKSLQISECDNISDDGFAILEQMTHLERLHIFNMRYVKDFDGLIAKLKKALPNCHIETTNN